MDITINSLNVPQTVFCLFYAIFWGLVANAQVGWKAFDWPLAIAGKKDPKYKPSWRRLGRSIWWLTAVPIILFIILISILGFAPIRPFGPRLIFQLLCVVIGAHAIFAPYRLWLSRMEANPANFFYPSSVEGNAEPGFYASQPNGLDKRPLDPRWSCSNRNVAIGYVSISLVCVFIAVIFG